MKKLMLKRETLIKYLFFLALSIELLILIIDKSALTNPFEGKLFQITFVLWLFVVLLTRYSLKEWILIVLFCILGMVSYRSTGRNEIIRVVMFIAASKTIPLRHTLLYTFYVTLIGMFLLVILSISGVLGTVSLAVDYGRGGIENRYTLGLGHPNALHCMFWALIALGIYLYFDYINVYILSTLFILNLFLYYLTVSKAGVLITTFTIICTLFFKYFKDVRDGKWVYFVGLLIILASVSFSVYAGISTDYDREILKIPNNMLTGRIFYAENQGGTEFWSLFSVPENIEYFDMGFIRMFYWYGIIPGVIFTLILCLMLRRAYLDKNYMALMLILSFTIYTVVEAHAVSVYITRNYLIMLLGGNWTKVFGVEDKVEKFFWQYLPVNHKYNQPI